MPCAGANTSEAPPATISPMTCTGWKVAASALKMLWRFARKLANLSFWRFKVAMRSSTERMGGLVKAERLSGEDSEYAFAAAERMAVNWASVEEGGKVPREAIVRTERGGAITLKIYR